ncbi:MAG: anhydro-N-acetylmuramic acid kinase [Cellvibrionaceae bacterium]|nr:anhydro-N-acetylmuramic acid kinase [Cellvibrionaceae bacterium]
MASRALYIGLMSGTSADGIDAGLVDFSGDRPQLLASLAKALPADTQSLVTQLAHSGQDEIAQLAELDQTLAEAFAEASLELLARTDFTPKDITAIGSHGQTLRHIPAAGRRGYTLQVGDPNIIAELSGICTVADFRRRDVAAGGHGAPLAPAFHQAFFRSQTQERAVINIGGMANISYLPKDLSQPVLGFDSGPGNVLMDAWIKRHKNQGYDKDGMWAKAGKVSNDLLTRLMQHPFIGAPSPKSTGREAFHLAWLETQLQGRDTTPEEVQATLLAFTCQSIAEQVLPLLGEAGGEVYICGGGAHNKHLMAALAAAMPGHRLDSTAALGIEPDWVEAMTFAWLAKQTLEGKPSNLPSVSGAKGPRILGGIYPA